MFGAPDSSALVQRPDLDSVAVNHGSFMFGCEKPLVTVHEIVQVLICRVAECELVEIGVPTTDIMHHPTDPAEVKRRQRAGPHAS